MVRDAYANYVVQTTLDVIPECEEKRLLLEELNAHSTELVSMSHDVNLLDRSDKVLPCSCFTPLEKFHFCQAHSDKAELLRNTRYCNYILNLGGVAIQTK
jgi:hypothetical protein